MTEQDFRRFIAKRPALNLSILAEELRVDRVDLHKIIRGFRKIPKARRGICLRIAQK